jgi:Zn-dependent peptidase ImmA (M78 family)
VAKSADAYVTPSALRWARESMGLTIEDAARKLGVSVEKLTKAERNEDHLTLRQAEVAAKKYERPFAALFLAEPPREEPPEAQFRRLRDAPALPWPPEMLALARRVRTRQDDAAELFELVEAEAPWTSLSVELSPSPLVSAERMRSALVDLAEQQSWRDRSGFRPLRAWIDAVESFGVFVMQDGTMSVDALRGFVSTHPVAPAIVVNTNDDPRARAFTVIHELGHLLYQRIPEHDPRWTAESWSDDFSAEVLMPRDAFLDSFNASDSERDLIAQVDAVALSFGVTALAAAVRLRRLDRIAEIQMTDLRRRLDERAVGKVARKGGNYYRTMVARLGPAYVQLVFQALDSQAVTYPAAAGLLGVKVNNFEKLRQTTLDRAGVA